EEGLTPPLLRLLSLHPVRPIQIWFEFEKSCCFKRLSPNLLIHLPLTDGVFSAHLARLTLGFFSLHNHQPTPGNTHFSEAFCRDTLTITTSKDISLSMTSSLHLPAEDSRIRPKFENRSDSL